MQPVTRTGSEEGRGSVKTKGLVEGPAPTVVIAGLSLILGPHSMVEDGVKIVTTLSEHIPSRVACDISLLVIISLL